MKLSDTFKKMRASGVPLCAIETADPAGTIDELKKSLADNTPILRWDLCRGLRPLNDVGVKAMGLVCPEGTEVQSTNPAEALNMLSAEKAPQKMVVFYMNAHRFLSDASVAQAMWNLRDKFKGEACTLVLLAPQVALPAELKHDVMVVTEPLPDKDAINVIVDDVLVSAETPKDFLPEDRRPKVIDSMLGLSAFAAEQCFAMSLTKGGVDEASLWERKRRMIEQTPGLKVWKDNSTFDSLGGLDALKQFFRDLLNSGNTPVRAIGFIDEIEKALGGAAGDTSGTSQDQLSQLLTEMEDNNIPGAILLGPPGTGKSGFTKAMGNEAGGAPTIAIDLGGMKGSLVGESEQKIRAAMQVFRAVSQGKGIFIATCNKIAALPPELRRRFTLGTFFMDLPTAEERKKIWPLWLDRFSLQDKCDGTDGVPSIDKECDGWTGAEIKALCSTAYRTGYSLEKAYKYVVPVIKSAPESIEALRNLAHNRFLSASKEGYFVNTELVQQIEAAKKRVINTQVI